MHLKKKKSDHQKPAISLAVTFFCTLNTQTYSTPSVDEYTNTITLVQTGLKI
jgi:hypothetical protein